MQEGLPKGEGAVKESKAGTFLTYVPQARDFLWQKEILLPGCCREIAGGKRCALNHGPFQQNQRGNRKIHSRMYRELENAGKSG